MLKTMSLPNGESCIWLESSMSDFRDNAWEQNKEYQATTLQITFENITTIGKNKIIS